MVFVETERGLARAHGPALLSKVAFATLEPCRVEPLLPVSTVGAKIAPPLLSTAACRSGALSRGALAAVSPGAGFCP